MNVKASSLGPGPPGTAGRQPSSAVRVTWGAARRGGWLVPKHAAGRCDLLQDLVFGQLADHVTPRRAVEFAAPGCGHPLVIAITPATPFGETAAAVLASLHRL